MASERRTEAQDRAKAATGSACYSGKVYKNVPDEVCAVRYRRTEVVTRADARLLWKQGRRAFSFLSGRGVEGILVSFIAQSVLV